MIENFLNFVISPREAAYRLSKEGAGKNGAIILVLAALSAVAGFTLLFEMSREFSLFFLTWGLIARIAAALFIMLLISAGYHFFAGIYGGECSPGKLYTGIFYTLSPFCFIAPVALVLKAFAGGAAIIFMAFFIIFLIWRFFYGQYNIINYFYGLKGRRAAAVLLLPWVVTAGVFLILPLFLMAGITIFLI